MLFIDLNFNLILSSRAWNLIFFIIKVMSHLWKLGYSSEDIITNIFRVCKTVPMPEYLKELVT